MVISDPTMPDSPARRIRRMTARAWAAAVFGSIALAAAPARADVIEVGDDGSVLVRGGAGAVGWQDGTVDAEAAPDVPEAAVTMLADPLPVPVAYQAAVSRSAQRYAISPDLLVAMVGRESAWRADAVSRRGAAGLTQLMPATARMLAVDPRDPQASLDGGARYLRQMLDRFGGDVERALAAYNAGPGRVMRAAGIPAIAETRAYVSAIIDRLSPLAAVASNKGLIR